MKTKYIDSGFYQISTANALTLAGGVLPFPGYKRLISTPKVLESIFTSDKLWLTRTKVNGKQVWAVYEA